MAAGGAVAEPVVGAGSDVKQRVMGEEAPRSIRAPGRKHWE